MKLQDEWEKTYGKPEKCVQGLRATGQAYPRTCVWRGWRPSWNGSARRPAATAASAGESGDRCAKGQLMADNQQPDPMGEDMQSQMTAMASDAMGVLKSAWSGEERAGMSAMGPVSMSHAGNLLGDAMTSAAKLMPSGPALSSPPAAAPAPTQPAMEPWQEGLNNYFNYGPERTKQNSDKQAGDGVMNWLGNKGQLASSYLSQSPNLKSTLIGGGVGAGLGAATGMLGGNEEAPAAKGPGASRHRRRGPWFGRALRGESRRCQVCLADNKGPRLSAITESTNVGMQTKSDHYDTGKKAWEGVGKYLKHGARSKDHRVSDCKMAEALPPPKKSVLRHEHEENHNGHHVARRLIARLMKRLGHHGHDGHGHHDQPALTAVKKAALTPTPADQAEKHQPLRGDHLLRPGTLTALREKTDRGGGAGTGMAGTAPPPAATPDMAPATGISEFGKRVDRRLKTSS
jgi:hypothetical protein